MKTFDLIRLLLVVRDEFVGLYFVNELECLWLVRIYVRTL
jgi:hypothetical protein